MIPFLERSIDKLADIIEETHKLIINDLKDYAGKLKPDQKLSWEELNEIFNILKSHLDRFKSASDKVDRNLYNEIQTYFNNVYESLSEQGLAIPAIVHTAVNILDDSFKRIKTIPERQFALLRSTLLVDYFTGKPFQSMLEKLESVGTRKSMAYICERIYRTEIMKAVNKSQFEIGAQIQVHTPEPLMKEWVATSDERTRMAHRLADGQIVPINEPFNVGMEKLMYPGDPIGSAANVINCRCTMIIKPAMDVMTARAAPEQTKVDCRDFNKLPEYNSPAKVYPNNVEGLARLLGIDEDTIYDYIEHPPSINWEEAETDKEKALLYLIKNFRWESERFLGTLFKVVDYASQSLTEEEFQQLKLMNEELKLIRGGYSTYISLSVPDVETLQNLLPEKKGLLLDALARIAGEWQEGVVIDEVDEFYNVLKNAAQDLFAPYLPKIKLSPKFQAFYEKHGAILKRLWQLDYEQTQAFLKEQGISEMRLYRGTVLPSLHRLGFTNDNEMPFRTLYQPASADSWTPDIATAQWFGKTSIRFLVMADIPAEDIISLPWLTQGNLFGCPGEFEVLVKPKYREVVATHWYGDGKFQRDGRPIEDDWVNLFKNPVVKGNNVVITSYEIWQAFPTDELKKAWLDLSSRYHITPEVYARYLYTRTPPPPELMERITGVRVEIKPTEPLIPIKPKVEKPTPENYL